MATLLSNLDLINKCKRFVLSDPTKENLDDLIKDALISAEREIRAVDQMGGPLAWLRERYDELFTRPYATITAITQASPGVITAESSDSDITGHGFSEDDLVVISGIGGMEELNNRLFRVAYVSATTLTLKQVHDQIDVATTSYTEYDSGGVIYHAGIKLPSTTIEPTVTLEADECYRWSIGQIYKVTFDMYPASPFVGETLNYTIMPSGRPIGFQHDRYFYSDPSSPEHFIKFKGLAGQRYNIGVHFEKSYPDLGTGDTWTTAYYPPHPAEIHDYIWHRALANLAGNAEKMKRTTRDGGDNTKIEILHAQKWMSQVLNEENKIIDFSRKLLGSGSTSVRA